MVMTVMTNLIVVHQLSDAKSLGFRFPANTPYSSTRLAMAAQSAAIGAGSVVQGAGQPQWRPSQEDDHRGAGAQAAGGAVEICDCRRRHRGRHCEERLKGDQKKLKQSTGTRSVSADPGG